MIKRTREKREPVKIGHTISHCNVTINPLTDEAVKAIAIALDTNANALWELAKSLTSSSSGDNIGIQFNQGEE